MREPYEVLGVARSATQKEIKAAYRKLAKRLHPDQNREDPEAQKKFGEITRAYEILGDEKKRGAFDRGEIDAEGRERFRGFEGADADPFAAFRQSGGRPHFEFRSGGGRPFGGGNADIFSELFGQAFAGGGGRGGAQSPGKGADIEVSMTIGLEEAATGAKVTALFPDGRRIAVKLPRYVEDGQVIRLKGQGQPDPFGGEPGDAMVRLVIRPHPRFRVEGRDLHADLPIELADAVLGAKVPFETLTGRVAVTVPAWSDSGATFRLKGQGLPLKAEGAGALYVHLQVKLPRGDGELEALMRARRG